MSPKRIHTIRKYKLRNRAKKKISVNTVVEEKTAPVSASHIVAEVEEKYNPIIEPSQEPQEKEVLVNSLFIQNTNKPNDLLVLAKQRMAERKNQEEINTNSEENLAESIGNADINKEVFDAVWNAYIKELEDKGNRRISSFIKERVYQIVSSDKVKLTLFSNLEKEMFEAERLTVLPFFRSRLKNGTFDFEFEIVNNSSTENKLLTAEQKFKLMAQKNPLLNDLQRIFELQIEY